MKTEGKESGRDCETGRGRERGKRQDKDNSKGRKIAGGSDWEWKSGHRQRARAKA